MKRRKQSKPKPIPPPLDYKNGEFLGAGFYNCVVMLVKKNNQKIVYRIGIIDPDKTEDEQKTQLNTLQTNSLILKTLNNEEIVSSLGSMVLKQLDDPRRFSFDELPRKIKEMLTNEPDSICKDVIKEKKRLEYTYFLHKIEYIKGKTLSDTKLETKQEQNAVVFKLLMYFITTQEYIEFSHGDLKPDNIMMRESTIPLQQKFTSYNNTEFVVKSKYIPVVIDFDFAETKEIHQFFTSGTYDYASVEGLIARLQSEKLDEVGRLAYDWWAIGIIAIELWTGLGYWSLINKILSKVNEKDAKSLEIFTNNLYRIFNLVKGDESTKVIQCIYGVMLLHYALFDLPFKYKAKVKQNDGVTDEINVDFVVDASDSVRDNVVNGFIKRLLQKYVSDDGFELLKVLLQCDPAQRLNKCRNTEFNNLQFMQQYKKKEPKPEPIKKQRKNRIVPGLRSDINCVTCGAPAIWPVFDNRNDRVYCDEICRL